MKLSHLVEVTADCLELPNVYVSHYARFLREAKLVSTGSTGGGAANMTSDDCLMLLCAVGSSESARSCAERTKIVAGLTGEKQTVIGVLRSLKPSHIRFYRHHNAVMVDHKRFGQSPPECGLVFDIPKGAHKRWLEALSL